MRLNGFLDLAESRSTHTTGRIASCDDEYTFKFLTLKSAEGCNRDAQSADMLHSVTSTVKVPATLVSATSPSLNKEWTNITARCAVDLLQKASMDVPQELLEASVKTVLPRFSASTGGDTDGMRYSQNERQRTTRSSSVLSREEVVKMTLQNIREHEDFKIVEDHQSGHGGFRPVSEYDMPGKRSRKKQTRNRGGAYSGGKSDYRFTRRKDREALVWQIFNSKRVSVSPGMEGRPEEVMRAASDLQAFLLAHSEDLALHDTRWASTILMLTPKAEVDEANAAIAKDKEKGQISRNVVHVPCPLTADVERDELVKELRRAVFGENV